MSDAHFLVERLLVSTPVLLVYVVGVILPIIFWRRYPLPSLFTLIAMAVLLVESLTQTFLMSFLLQAKHRLAWDPVKVNWVLSAVGLTDTFIRATALALLLGAVFSKRKPAVSTP